MTGEGLDFNDIFLEAETEVIEIFEEVFQELLEPAGMRAVRMRWATLTPDQKEELKRNDPEMYKLFAAKMSNQVKSGY